MLKKYIWIIITMLMVFSFYFTPRSIVAYNTRNLTAVSSKTVEADILKVVHGK